MHVSCSVCFEVITNRDDVVATICGHIFHFLCLQQWLQNSNSCPSCRQKTELTDIFKLFFNDDSQDLSTLPQTMEAKLLLSDDLDETLLRMLNKQVAVLSCMVKICSERNRVLSSKLDEMKKRFRNYQEGAEKKQREMMEYLENEIVRLGQRQMLHEANFPSGDVRRRIIKSRIPVTVQLRR